MQGDLDDSASSRPTLDSDGDGILDVCDNNKDQFDQDNDGIIDSEDPDDDNDGILDVDDPDHPNNIDSDNDGIPDVLDEDDFDLFDMMDPNDERTPSRNPMWGPPSSSLTVAAIMPSYHSTSKDNKHYFFIVFCRLTSLLFRVDVF